MTWIFRNKENGRQMLIDGTGRQIGDEKGTEGTGGKDNSFA